MHSGVSLFNCNWYISFFFLYRSYLMHSVYMSYKIIHAFTSLHQRCIDALVDTNISWKTGYYIEKYFLFLSVVIISKSTRLTSLITPKISGIFTLAARKNTFPFLLMSKYVTVSPMEPELLASASGSSMRLLVRTFYSL